MKKKRITIYDLAQALNISPSYVSKALNRHPSVSTEMEKRVTQKARELNYRQNKQAANLREGLSHTLGVIVPHIDHRFFSGVIAGMEDSCFQHQYNLIICQSHESFEKEATALDTLIRQNVDGILISVSAATRSSEVLREVENNGIPLIQFDRCQGKEPGLRVMNNNMEASAAATEMLINEGYRQIAFIGGPAFLSNYGDRLKGYKKTMQLFGLPIASGYIIENALQPEEAAIATAALLSRTDKPDCIITVSDHQALSILQLAKEKGISIPDELGLISFANESFASLLVPGLSSIDQHSNEMGRTAAEMYFSLMESGFDRRSREEIIHTSIHWRGSSARSGYYKPGIYKVG
jgi:LacI family transcriptional regulator